MPVWLQVLLALVGGGVFVALGKLGIDALRKAGADAARAERASQDLAVAKRQGEIMGEQKTVDDAQADLRHHRF